ncbi:hypothetical protein PABG_07655 [Paracoccidioides brasiliensis Pb03]|uniref:Uncharacterized protein n=1 Tax=Paracoccidioides brasiliensis TaxID=121759 RepID=A0A1D2J2M8_PARBR|nr:hypothetical protein PABG_07655 [Paracoccidioides brasiliensis Pb03]ODH12549.1 hypothetical protein ACO22_08155 [Paracoccidioides brasiliensis]ODH45809.1 hypothetical protein GX48_08113 [Paracoccidioides brasiliensis]
MPHRVINSYTSSTTPSQNGKSVKIHNVSYNPQVAPKTVQSSKQSGNVVVHNHRSRTYDEKRRSDWEAARWK